VLVEPKFDGFRVIGFCLPDGVYLQSSATTTLKSSLTVHPDAARHADVGAVE
jgi:hypothetical protein